MTLPKVVVTRRLPQQAWDVLRAQADLVCWEQDCPVDRKWLLDHLPEAEGLYCLLTDRIDREVLQAGKRLRVISTMAVGYDHIDVAGCTACGIPVGHTPGILTETTADLAFALLLSAARRIVEGAEYVRKGQWATWSPDLLLGQDVHGATLGIVGFGRIGQAMARRAQGFQMKVLAVRSPQSSGSSGSGTQSFATPVLPREDSSAGINQGEPVTTSFQKVDLHGALAQSDFVSLHVPLTPHTHHLIGEAEFRAMKPSSILINTARGAVVDPEALYHALVHGHIGGAALDVTDPEPIPASHPLLTLPNCLVIPHLGSASVATRTRMACIAAENIVAGLRGDALPHCVNPEVYQRSFEI
ncbi:D-glycerate dehydrogenase [uncultured Nitrospira sp.]|uniref:2-hydroxyacid dehydrogenase n=1 Tax=uncultured Nitrospira sp. TaxID=157176 RepID=UPI00313FF0AD